MFLFVGLGNPGSEYANSRHNVGYMAVDIIARRRGFSREKKKFKGQLCEGEIGEEKILILKPETYMNKSGEAVLAAASFYKIHPQNIVVFHDDMDIELGKIKIKIGGGHAGHNGIKSIDAAIGREYIRIRMGVGHPERGDAIGHVLGGFIRNEEDVLKRALNIVENDIEILIKGGLDKFATKIGAEVKNGI